MKFDAKRLVNKVAIITAGTNGIGLAIAERLGHEGARVAISSRNNSNVLSAVDYLVNSGLERKNIYACVCHVGKAEDRQQLIDNTIKEFGRIDILVNNAGINPVSSDILDVSEQTWDKLFAINLKSGFLLTKLVVPHLLKVGGGNIIFNASIGGFNINYPIAAYGITKTAIFGLTKALANSLASKNIRVNCISPGVIKTKMSEFLWKNTIKNEETDLKTFLPIDSVMKRFGEPHECASVVAFLVSQDASFITGENIVVAGGEFSRL